MLKKIISIIFAVAAIGAPVAPAHAWDRVCVKLPLWKTWFAADFEVIYDFPENSGEIPGTLNEGRGAREYREYRKLPKALGGNKSIEAKGNVRSQTARANQTQCVDIRRIPNGAPFFVYVQPHSGNAVVCDTHSSNPNRWYHQQNRPYGTLNYESWGTSLNARCKFTHES